MYPKESKYYFIDYIFWFLLTLYSNPGGIIQALGLKASEGSVSVKDLMFFSLVGCFVFIKYHKRNLTYEKIIKYFIIFGAYYFIVFGYFTPIFKGTLDYSYFNFVKKNRTTIYSFVLFVIVYVFYIRSYLIFYKFLVVSCLIILSLFLISYTAGVEILPYEEIDRRFIDVKRVFLISYGDYFLFQPIGFTILVFIKIKFKWKKLILTAFFLTAIAILLTISRRHMLGFFIYFILTTMLFNYYHRKPLLPVKKIISSAFYILIFGVIISFSFPKHFEAAKVGFEESLNVVTTGETSAGTKDARLGLGKEFMQDLIANNYYFGTGFDNRWRTKEGDTQGYEASDYPLLGAIAMTGIFGLLFFLPVYIVLAKAILYDIKFFRTHNNINFHTVEFLALNCFIIFFLYHFMQYINLFTPVSLSGKSFWYIYLAMYFGSREVFYNSQRVLIEEKM